jgi:hypothetical protein
MTSSPGQLEEAGADSITTTLLETRQQLASLLPVLAQSRNDSSDRARRGGTAQNNTKKRGKPGRGASEHDVAAAIVSP